MGSEMCIRDSLETFKQVIVNNLTKRSRYGTEDDISLSCVFDSDFLTEKESLIKEKIEENKKLAAERKAELLKKQV